MPILPVLPLGMPSALLQPRPDIAAYYPNITLSGDDGFSRSPLSGLFHVANNVWSIGASADETLLDFGARAGAVNAAKAVYQSDVASYRLMVLSALQSVENDLSSVRILADQRKQLDVAIGDEQDLIIS